MDASPINPDVQQMISMVSLVLLPLLGPHFVPISLTFGLMAGSILTGLN